MTFERISRTRTGLKEGPRPVAWYRRTSTAPAASGCSDACVALSVTMHRFDRTVDGATRSSRPPMAGSGTAHIRGCPVRSRSGVAALLLVTALLCGVMQGITRLGLAESRLKRRRSSAACRHMTLLDLLWTARMLERRGPGVCPRTHVLPGQRLMCPSATELEPRRRREKARSSSIG